MTDQPRYDSNFAIFAIALDLFFILSQLIHFVRSSNMAESHHGENGANSLAIDPANEQTPLLHPNSRNGMATIDGMLADDESNETDVDPNEFDLMLSRSTSFNGGLGIEAQSQETSMLRRTQVHHAKRVSRTSSPDSTTRKLLPNGTSHEGPPDEGGDSPKSQYLGGVSVKRFWLIFSCILLSFTLSSFDSTIMVSSHPVITSYFHSSNSASWLSTAFLLTSTSFQPIFGRLSDATGRKLPYLFSLAIFVLATIWCALAQSMISFIVARAVCGFGAGGMISMGSIITSDLIPIETRGAYQSYLNIMYGLGSAAGAALGGAIADHLGWRWEFGVQVPGLVICWFVSYFTVPSTLGRSKEHKTIRDSLKVFDYKGSFFLTSTVTFFILAINLGGNIFPWSHPMIITFIVLTVICLPIFIRTQYHASHPIMPLSLLTRNPRAGLIFANSLGAVLINGVLFNIPLYFQAVLLETPTASGLRLIVPSLAASSIGTLTGFLITWTRELKAPLIAGTILAIIGTVALSCMDRHLPDWTYILLLIPSSMGQGFVFPGTFMAVLAVSEQSEQAVVTTTLVLWRSLGQVLGVAVSSLVVQNSLLVFLEENVTGPDKQKVIEAVRSSVQAIAGLEKHYRDQVVDSYAQSLRATFVLAAVLSVVAFFITLRIRLPKLGHRA
ncbi:major facilitator superfamily transporter protein [Rutstroemia sp. NJR-2017a WRK4]|nr:major facilitator superfamily transporter protein [Rutstroemia sp. NJR-2017a WRK4]